jgi:hypothetical protein
VSLLNNEHPWSVTTWWHTMHPDEIPKDYKGNTRYQRPVIVDKDGCFIAEFGVGFGFEHAMSVAKYIVRLANQDAKESER